MVEGLVVIPFFIMIFGGIMFAGNVYDQKLQTMAKARELAWVDAATNCGREATFLPPIGSLDAVVAGGPGTQLCDQNFKVTTKGQANANVSVQGDAVDFTQHVQARIPPLFCNEPTQGADFQSAVGFLWHAITGSTPAASAAPPVVAPLTTYYADPYDVTIYPMDDLYMYYY